MAELVHRQYAKCHQKLESMKIIRSFDHVVKITPAAAGPNPFAGHFPFPVPALNHFRISEQVFYNFMINDPVRIQRFGQAKHKGVSRTSHLNTFQWPNSGKVTREKLSESLQLQLHPSTCYCILDIIWQFIQSFEKSFAKMKSAWCTHISPGRLLPVHAFAQLLPFLPREGVPGGKRSTIHSFSLFAMQFQGNLLANF